MGIPEVASTFNTALDKYISKGNQKGNPQNEHTTSFGVIRTNRIMQSISEEGIENFTFRVNVEDNDPKTFYNLIIRKELDGSFAEPYLKKYTMGDEFFAAYYNNTKNLNEFEGFYNNYGITEDLDIDVLLGNNGTGKNSSSDPCPVPVDDDGDTPNPGDSGDPADGGSGGGSTSGGYPSGSGTSSGSNPDVYCTSRLVANVCNGGGGHYGEKPSCTGSFKGSIQLITTCTDGSTDQQDLNKGAVSTAKNSDCPIDDGDVGMLDDEDEEPPCQKMAKLVNNTDFKQKMVLLKKKAMTDNHESAFKMKSTGVDQYDYGDIIEGEPDGLGLDPQVGDNEQIDGFIHNHNNDGENRDLSVFSPLDLWTLYNWLKNDNIANHRDFVYVVTTAQGTNYALTIKSKSRFLAFGNDYLEGLQFKKTKNNFLPHIYDGQDDEIFPGGIKKATGTALSEKNFAKMLLLGGGQGDTGLGLLRADANFESWQELEYDPATNSVSPTDCN